MSFCLREVRTPHSPESLVERLSGHGGLILLRSAWFDSVQTRFSFVTARPFLTFRSFGTRCELRRGIAPGSPSIHFGDPWRLLEALMCRYELIEEVDLPFPLGGCFGYWGYELKNFTEPRLARRAIHDLDLPDCHVGFYGSLVVFDHRLGKTWIIATGLDADGSRSRDRAEADFDFWGETLQAPHEPSFRSGVSAERRQSSKPFPAALSRDAATPRFMVPMRGNKAVEAINNPGDADSGAEPGTAELEFDTRNLTSNCSRDVFMRRVERAQAYIRAGDIYQANLSHRLTANWPWSGWELFRRLASVSPAPYSACLDCGDFEIVSSSPELFLRLSGAEIQTRPIKGTRPRGAEPTRDSQLAYELQTSAKEVSELVMITDLLRNDLGKVCEFGSVQVPELMRLERYPQVQHLVSTVLGRLRPELTHLAALASCFPGGSITGAPKFRAMEIIDGLESFARGPYSGALGYLGFNRESQLSIIIRSAICRHGLAHFPVGAGIVADSDPAAEYEETLAKARGFCDVVRSGLTHREGRPGGLREIPRKRMAR